jgi:hypothetical protein
LAELQKNIPFTISDWNIFYILHYGLSRFVALAMKVTNLSI